MNMIPKLGSCYYPEHWPEEQWRKDAEDMISSGLSWFAGANGVEVIMISGFTDAYVECEDKCTRRINKQKCNGCRVWDTFEKSDGNW